MVRILYFARIRDAVGIDKEDTELPKGVTTVSGLLDWIRQRGGTWAEQLDRPFKVAVNQELAGVETPLRDGDEVAVFPPVTGG
jgi:sulfur-carrier protein